MIGGLLLVTTFADWTAYGKAQDSLAGDSAYQSLLAEVQSSDAGVVVSRTILKDIKI